MLHEGGGVYYCECLLTPNGLINPPLAPLHLDLHYQILMDRQVGQDSISYIHSPYKLEASGALVRVPSQSAPQRINKPRAVQRINKPPVA